MAKKAKRKKRKTRRSDCRDEGPLCPTECSGKVNGECRWAALLNHAYLG